MKNYEVLLRKISTWLRPWSDERESYLFVHIFCHRTTPYHFEEGDGWMAKTFFSGGTMPSHDLFVCPSLLSFISAFTHALALTRLNVALLSERLNTGT